MLRVVKYTIDIYNMIKIDTQIFYFYFIKNTIQIINIKAKTEIRYKPISKKLYIYKIFLLYKIYCSISYV